MKTRLWVVAFLAALGSGCTTVEVTRTTAPEARPAADAAVIRRIESGASTPRFYRNGAPVTEPVGEDALVRVVDVGQALCVVGVSSSGYAFLIDAGHWQGGACKAAIDELVPADEGLALVVLTHNDSDHLGELPKIVATRGIDLSSTPLEPGEQFQLGPIRITFLAGWGTYPSAQGMSASEFENAVSIMVRIEAAGGSVIVTGDAIGRPLGQSNEDTCAVSEDWAV